MGDGLTYLGNKAEFSLSSLRAGEYRVFAVPRESSGILADSKVFDRVLERAERVTLSSGQSQTLDLKIVDLSQY